MSVCGGISLGADFDCANPIVPGVDVRLLLANLSDIEGYTYDGTQTDLITGITMVTGKTFYAFQGYRQSLAPSVTAVPGTVSFGYDHQVGFFVFDISQAQKANLEKLALGSMVAIVQNANAVGNADGVFEVFGKGVGMEVSELSRINNDSESQGAFNIVLKTSDTGGKEPKLPQNLWDTDFVTTKALVDSLLV